MIRSLLVAPLVCLALGCGSSTSEGSSAEATTASASTSAGEATSGTSETTGTTGTSESTDTSESADTGTADLPIEPFTLTSPSFLDGAPMPGKHHSSGGNVSPQLDWIGAPVGTLSFAVFFHDETIDFEHSAIWDIPASAAGLPEDVEHQPMPANVPGAVQTRAWNNAWGYGGPGSASNFYAFTVYALDVASLSEIDQDSSLVEARAAFELHELESTTLQGQSAGPSGP